MDGFVQMGNDGVVRSWDGDGKVIDYVRLNNRQLIHSVHLFGGHSKRDKDSVLESLRDVNGHDVSSDEVFNPPEHIKPLEFRDVQPPMITAPAQPIDLEDALLKRARTTTTLRTITHSLPSS